MLNRKSGTKYKINSFNQKGDTSSRIDGQLLNALRKDNITSFTGLLNCASPAASVEAYRLAADLSKIKFIKAILASDQRYNVMTLDHHFTFFMAIRNKNLVLFKLLLKHPYSGEVLENVIYRLAKKAGARDILNLMKENFQNLDPFLFIDTNSRPSRIIERAPLFEAPKVPKASKTSLSRFDGKDVYKVILNSFQKDKIFLLVNDKIEMAKKKSARYPSIESNIKASWLKKNSNIFPTACFGLLIGSILLFYFGVEFLLCATIISVTMLSIELFKSFRAAWAREQCLGAIANKDLTRDTKNKPVLTQASTLEDDCYYTGAKSEHNWPSYINSSLQLPKTFLPWTHASKSYQIGRAAVQLFEENDLKKRAHRRTIS